MRIPTQLKNVESQLTTLHHRLDTIKELQWQQKQLLQEWNQIRKQRQNAEAKQRGKQILQDVAAITQLIQSISSMDGTLRIFENGMHIHSSTEEDSEEHDKKNGENSTDEEKTMEKEMEKLIEKNLELQELVKEYLKLEDKEEDLLKKMKNLSEKRFMLVNEVEASKGLFS